MLITTSRKTNIFQKEFCKLLGCFFSDVTHVPRGETPLSLFFEKAAFLGHKCFLLVSKKRKEIHLNILTLRENSYFLENKYLVDNLKCDLKRPLSEIKKISKTEKPNFLDLFENNERDNEVSIIKEKDNFIFLINDKESGFSFSLKQM